MKFNKRFFFKTLGYQIVSTFGISYAICYLYLGNTANSFMITFWSFIAKTVFYWIYDYFWERRKKN